MQRKPVWTDQEEQLSGLQSGSDPTLRTLFAQVPADAPQGEDHPLRPQTGEHSAPRFSTPKA